MTRVEAVRNDLERPWAASPGRVSLGEWPTRAAFLRGEG